MLRENRKLKLGRCALHWLPGVSIGLLTLLGVSFLHPIEDLSANATDEVTLSAFLSPSITLSMSSSVSENIEPTVDGSFKNIATVARVQVMNSEYYDVSISGNPDMVGTNNPDEKIAAISGEKKASEFTANTWGYNVSKNGSGVATAVAANASTVYKPVPATSTQVVGRQATTNNAADDYYSLNFGAKVDTSIPADTYTSRVTLSVVASPVLATEYSLTYDSNGATGGTVPETQHASSYDESYEFTVAGNTGSLTKTGYTFLGWADSADATVAKYVANSKVTVSENDPNKIIYAVWRVAGPFNGITTMQELTADICENAETNETAQLKDTRDDKYYWVAKLPDGNCWTTQNMDYEISGKFTSIGTSRSSDGGYFWDDGLKVMSHSDSSTVTDVSLGWTASTDADFYTKNGNNAVDAANKVYDAHYLTGNYYQFSASSTVCIGMGGQWSLPTSGQAVTVNGSFNKLINGVTRGQVIASPYFFLIAGWVDGYNGALRSVGSEGVYWSSTSGLLYLNGSNVNPSYNHGTYVGDSVRCYVNGN